MVLSLGSRAVRLSFHKVRLAPALGGPLQSGVQWHKGFMKEDDVLQALILFLFLSPHSEYLLGVCIDLLRV